MICQGTEIKVRLKKVKSEIVVRNIGGRDCLGPEDVRWGGGYQADGLRLDFQASAPHPD